ncbi:hypothetical protein A2U01_0093937, partial [Trifolium medium]|nr:hypothetical protein [Trifolium medium]
VLVLAQRAQLCGAARRAFLFFWFSSGSYAARVGRRRNAQP